MNTIAFYAEDDDHKEVNFNQGTLIFTLQLIKICTIETAFKNLNVILIALGLDIGLLQRPLW